MRQSRCRISSPWTYWRCCLNSTLKPLWGERWRPVQNPSTTRRARTCRLEILCRSAGVRNSESCAIWAALSRAPVLEDLLRVAARGRVEDLLDDLVDRDALGLGVERGHDAVPQDGNRERRRVVERHVEAPLQDRADLAAQDPLLAGARARAPADQLLDEAGHAGVLRPRLADDVEHEVHHVVGDEHLAHRLLARDDLGPVDDALELGGVRARGPRHDLALLVALGVVHLDEEHEAVLLG